MDKPANQTSVVTLQDIEALLSSLCNTQSSEFVSIANRMTGASDSDLKSLFKLFRN